MAKGKFQGGFFFEEYYAAARGGEAEGIARVKLKEINGFGKVGVGFSPVLAHFIGEPGAELEFSSADDGGGGEDQGNSCFYRGSAPGLEGLEGRLHGFFGVLRAGFLVDADDLGRAGRVEGADFGLGLEAAAADDEVVFAA